MRSEAIGERSQSVGTGMALSENTWRALAEEGFDHGGSFSGGER